MTRETGLLAVAAIVLGAIGAGPGPAGGASGAATFDGNWTAQLVCPDTPGMALGYTWQLVGAIAGGSLKLQHGTVDTPNSGTLHGPIAPDGTARLSMDGVTGDAAYIAKKRVSSGAVYHYDIDARFQDRTGTGIRLGTGPACTLTFKKS